MVVLVRRRTNPKSLWCERTEVTDHRNLIRGEGDGSMLTSAEVQLMVKEAGFDMIRFTFLSQGNGPGA